MPWTDTELDPNLKDEILRFKDENMPEIYGLLEKHAKDKRVVIFKNREEADGFIALLDKTDRRD